MTRAWLDGDTFSNSVADFIRLGLGSFDSMKTFFLFITLAAMAAPVLAQDRPALKDTKDKVSYSIGLDIGGNLKRNKIDVNSDALSAGIKDGVTGAKPLMTDAEVQEVMTQFSKDMQEKTNAARQEAAQKNKTEGEKFLAENKNKPDVKTTGSGLQYKMIKEGSGTPPKATDNVVVNYRGTLIDGTEFDSSYKRGQPATFPVNGVIKGWTEALQLMKPGSKYELFIPSNLAYGERGAGADIGPNATLKFEVELLSVKSAASPSPSASASP
jgi:FKBP-type peptidyl-prolyl cis-trans isomerase